MVIRSWILFFLVFQGWKMWLPLMLLLLNCLVIYQWKVSYLLTALQSKDSQTTLLLFMKYKGLTDPVKKLLQIYCVLLLPLKDNMSPPECHIFSPLFLTHSHTMTPFDAPGKQAFWKHWEEEKLLVTSNFSFSPVFSSCLDNFLHFFQIKNFRLQTLSV